MAIIMISRGTFSGGQALAKALAARLGYPCISREEIVEAASWYAVPAETLAEMAQRPMSLWEPLGGERTAHIMSLRAALCERAEQGDLVYHGHAGHLLLPGISHVIRVRIIADMEFRIESVMRSHGLSRELAVSYIEKIDRERAEWTQFLYGIEWDDPSHYDVVLNLSRMSIASASESVARMAEQPDFQPTPESRKIVRDLGLGSRIWVALARDARTKATDVVVMADDGLVTIVGKARSPEVRDAVAAVAGRVEGVKEVRSRVGVVAA